MLSKNKIRVIASLNRKKDREREKAFLVEGDKMVLEAIHSAQDIRLICATSGFLESAPAVVFSAREIIEVTHEELRKASLLQAPQNALAVVGIPETPFLPVQLLDKFSLALDFVQDPGNLGTIIRIADWFGIEHILCSEDTADCYNPKAVQASMGSVFRVKVHYLDLPRTLQEAISLNMTVFGTFLEGVSIWQHPLSEKGILVVGNEGKGISPEVEAVVGEKLFIPPFPAGRQSAESLNVAAATAICCAEFRRLFTR